jgi:SAM-dependent methyltransferase
MHLDVYDLQQFYYRTRLGRAAQRAIREQVLSLWPSARNQTIVGFGFAVPLLRPYVADARRVVALMPGQQGVMPWPSGLPNVAVLCRETLWPLGDGLADRIVMLHGLETSEHAASLLDEAARVLAPSGKLLVIVPNRAGLWSRRDRTPFGFGRPYSLGQLEGQLGQHGFTAERHLAALFQPPSEQDFWLRTGRFWETAGRRISNRYAGGVLMVEAERHPPRPLRPGLPERVRKPIKAIGVVEPKPA